MAHSDLIVSQVTEKNSSSPSITLNQCRGDISPQFTANPPARVFIQGGTISLSSDYSPGFFIVNASQDAVVIPTLLPRVDRPSLSVFVPADFHLYGSAELRMHTWLFGKHVQILIYGSVSFYDQSRYSLYDLHKASNPPLVWNSVTLRNTTLIVVQCEPSRATYAAVGFFGKQEGHFSPDIQFIPSLRQGDLVSANFEYEPGRISFYYHSQAWPQIGWGAIAPVVLFAVGFVIAVVLLARRAAANVVGEVPTLGYSPVREARPV